MKQKINEILELLEFKGLTIKEACNEVGVDKKQLYKEISVKDKLVILRKSLIGSAYRDKQYLQFIEMNDFFNNVPKQLPQTHFSYNY